MKRIISVLLCVGFISSSYAAYVPNEYNVWRSSDGVLYGTTQTENNEPVLVSIVGPGTDWSTMVISFMSDQHCDLDKKTASVWINMKQEELDYSCKPVGHGSIITYTISNSKRAKELYFNLTSGFTLVIDKRINIWAANIKQPK